jgi:hypothetical protein
MKYLTIENLLATKVEQKKKKKIYMQIRVHSVLGLIKNIDRFDIIS